MGRGLHEVVNQCLTTLKVVNEAGIRLTRGLFSSLVVAKLQRTSTGLYRNSSLSKTTNSCRLILDSAGLWSNVLACDLLNKTFDVMVQMVANGVSIVSHSEPCHKSMLTKLIYEKFCCCSVAFST